MTSGKEGRYESPVKALLTGILDLFREDPDRIEFDESKRIDGKNVLITGASSGLGFAVSVELARRGANIYMACRSGIPEKGLRVKKLSGSGRVHMLEVDLSDLNSIQAMVNRIEERKIRFDIVICNAAIVPRESRKTRQGLEAMFMVNYMAKFLLTRLLIERKCLRSGPERKPRFIIVSSESHRNPKEFKWDEFGVYRKFGTGETVARYGYYKLLLTTFARELSRRLNAGNTFRVSVFVLCPGPVNSNIAREAPGIFKPLLKLIFALVFRSPKKAAIPVVYFAVSDSKETNGRPFDYLHVLSRKPIDAKASDEKNGKRLWDLSEGLLKKYGVEFKGEPSDLG